MTKHLDDFPPAPEFIRCNETALELIREILSEKTCPRCAGSGKWVEKHQICFRCNGAGKITSPMSRSPQEIEK